MAVCVRCYLHDGFRLHFISSNFEFLLRPNNIIKLSNLLDFFSLLNYPLQLGWLGMYTPFGIYSHFPVNLRIFGDFWKKFLMLWCFFVWISISVIMSGAVQHKHTHTNIEKKTSLLKGTLFNKSWPGMKVMSYPPPALYRIGDVIATFGCGDDTLETYFFPATLIYIN